MVVYIFKVSLPVANKTEEDEKKKPDSVDYRAEHVVISMDVHIVHCKLIQP